MANDKSGQVDTYSTSASGSEADARNQTARELERLRQQQETFDQRKRHDNLWFRLRLAMGIVALVLLPAVGGVSSYILLKGGYTGRVESFAGAALFGDVLGVIAAVWKIVVGSGSPTRLEPVIGPE